MISRLPTDGKAAYEATYKTALSYYGGDKEAASKVAWSTVKKRYKRDPTSKQWEKRASAESWKYSNVNIEDELKSASVTKDMLIGTTGDSTDLSKAAMWDDDIKMGICIAIRSQNKELLRKVAQSDITYNKILLDNYLNCVVQ